MPHQIDFDGLERDLFVLQHVAYGSPRFCSTIKLTRGCYGGDYEWWEYTGLLKSIVSNTVIESAIKIRMIQDFIKYDEQAVDLTEMDSQAREDLIIGSFENSDLPLTIRDSCNKIVHATEARLKWVTDEEPEPEDPLEYWNGTYDLWGKNQGKPWHVELNIASWCTAMIRFNKDIQESVDWNHVFKHDE